MHRREWTVAAGVAFRVAIGAALFALVLARSAAAQPAQPAPATDRWAVSSTIDAETLADLPVGNNIYSVLETTQPELISDRFNGSGLNVGEAARIGGFLGSWSQTLFRIGDVDIADPAGSGAPLLFPELLFWQQVDIVNGMMPADLNSPGLGVVLEPRRPATAWTTTVLASGSGGGLAGGRPSGSVPPIARLEDLVHTSALVSGPAIANRLGVVAGGTWTQASKLVRETTPAADSDLDSGFVNLVYAASPESELRTLGWIQRARVPFEYRQLFSPAAATRDQSAHVQATWERRVPSGLNWRAIGGFTGRSRTNDLGPVSSTVMDRLIDGPVPAIESATGDVAARRWTVGARIVPSPSRSALGHISELGVDIDGARVRTSDPFTGSIGELVDNVPARAWAFTHPDAESHRHSTTVAVYASDRLSLSPTLTLDAAIRFESITGRADGASAGVSWRTWLPRAAVRWEFAENDRFAFVAGYRRAANRLNLDLLSFGDPAAPTATVTRWLSASPLLPPVANPLATVIDRVGPGTGGNPAFSGIDPDLKRPYTDEFVVGLESRRRGWLRLGLTGIARREADLIGAVDLGVPISSYSTIGIPDEGHDFGNPEDDQILPIYNRLPSSFGRNQYLLTNPGQEAATAFALTLTAEGSTDRLFLLFGATASAANGASANRGYDPLENDQDALGELFTNPNAATHARGRLFNDRAFTIKWTTVYRFPGDVHLGAIARYQDGQPSSRLVVAQALNQGGEAVRAFPNGGNRFTFTGTLDLRVQKQFTIGAVRLAALIDLYNLITRSNEVEEYVVTGPAFRTPTAIEPVPSMHLGVRFTF